MHAQTSEDLLDATLVAARFATDSGARIELVDAIEMLGFDRAELEAELAEEIADGLI
ncbi:hypothetical protein M5J20_04795 [Corynebacterium sp. TA-R-1]|uniref:Uncharacterized protein n=1 Tax=Corynebacterium stercoris TaxID=2943490 RepID=A0ABT1G0E3_9CORY|nr:hypothetical protein [Corynebacterium stercoris]MCP1387504.1 hypothetical protein [Corynebacterium stercoris]